MEQPKTGIKWSGRILRERTYEEQVERLAEDRWVELAAQWLSRPGPTGSDRPWGPQLRVRGVRGLTSDGAVHRSGRTPTGFRKTW